MILGCDVMARHWDLKAKSLRIYFWIDQTKFFCCSLGFWFASFNGVFVVVETLPDRVGIAYF